MHGLEPLPECSRDDFTFFLLVKPLAIPLLQSILRGAPPSKTLFLIAQLPVASLSGKQGPGVIPGIGLNRNVHTPRK